MGFEDALRQQRVVGVDRPAKAERRVDPRRRCSLAGRFPFGETEQMKATYILVQTAFSLGGFVPTSSARLTWSRMEVDEVDVYASGPLKRGADLPCGDDQC